MGSVADRRAAKAKANVYKEEDLKLIQERQEREADELLSQKAGTFTQGYTAKQTKEDIAAVKIQAQARRKQAEKEAEEMRKRRSEAAQRGGGY